MRGKQNITLIGMPGAGKSVLGRKLARKLKYKFLDIDDVVKKQFGLELQDIIDRFGEKKFLKAEEKAVLGLRRVVNCVISPGGSVVYSKGAMAFLKKISKIIFLKIPLNEVRSRIPNINTRGIVGLKTKKIRELYKERRPFYEKYADVVVDISGNFDVVKSLKEVAIG